MMRNAVAALLLVLLAAAPAAAQEWLPSRREAAAAAAVLAGAALLDGTVDRAVPEGGGTRWGSAAAALNHGGRPHYAVLALGAAAVGGAAAGEPRLRDGALRVAAGLGAAGVVNGALKVAVGRERPGATDDPHSFRPLNLQNRWQSFPSGHAVVAFSLAGALAEETGEPWVAAAGYGAAVLVGWSRVYEDKHWTSDVVAGALIGAAAGRGTVRFLRARGGAAPQVALAPGWIVVRIPLR